MTITSTPNAFSATFNKKINDLYGKYADRQNTQTYAFLAPTFLRIFLSYKISI
jgi:hypothetical protein